MTFLDEASGKTKNTPPSCPTAHASELFPGFVAALRISATRKKPKPAKLPKCLVTRLEMLIWQSRIRWALVLCEHVFLRCLCGIDP